MNIENIKNKKIAMVFGKSIEGCGVQRGGVEMQMWCHKNNITFDIFSYDERTFNKDRVNGHGAKNVMSFMEEDLVKTREQLEQYDVVIFNSYPSPKNENSAIYGFYFELVKKLKNPIKVGMMHELNKTNIDKIPYLVGMMNECDVLYNFTEKSWFSQTISNLLPSKKLGARMNKFTMWFNFDEFESFRNEIPLAQKKRELLYASRWTTSKVPRRVLDMAPLLDKTHIAGKLIGIERSIGAKTDIFDHPNCIDCTGKEIKPAVDTSCRGVEVYGPFVRSDGLKQLQNSLFGCSFYRLPKDADGYGDRMEYAMIEIIAAGAIPVFDAHWADNNRTLDGRAYSEIPYACVISHEDKLQETVDELVKISLDEDLQKKYFDTSYEIVKNEFDVNLVLPRMLSHIISVGKDINKYENDNDLILAITQNEKFSELYSEYTARKDVVVLGIRELTNNIFAIIDGKKEKEIKTWKTKKIKPEIEVSDDLFSF